MIKNIFHFIFCSFTDFCILSFKSKEIHQKSFLNFHTQRATYFLLEASFGLPSKQAVFCAPPALFANGLWTHRPSVRPTDYLLFMWGFKSHTMQSRMRIESASEKQSERKKKVLEFRLPLLSGVGRERAELIILKCLLGENFIFLPASSHLVPSLVSLSSCFIF